MLAVDVTAGDQPVVVRVHARDDASGVAALRLRLLDPDQVDGGFDTAMTRVSGTARDGIWQATVTLGQCGTVAGTWTAQLKLTDAAGRSRQYLSGQPTLAVTARDNLVPQVVRTYVLRRAGAVVLRGRHRDLRDQRAGLRRRRQRRPGCLVVRRRFRRAVSCAVGSVRTATYTPVPSFAPTGQLFVELNPDGSLGVTDLAGNPVGRRYVV